MESCNNSPHLPKKILIEVRKVVFFYNFEGNTENTKQYVSD